MSCERFRDAITDHACGAAIASDAAAHLASCAGCRRAFDAHQRALADVDAALAETLAVRVAPDFVARVVTSAITSRPQKSLAGLRSSWWVGLAAAAAVALAVFLAWRPADRPLATDARILPAQAGSHAAGEKPAAGSHAAREKPSAAGSHAPTQPAVTPAVASSFSRKGAAVAERRVERPVAVVEPEVLVPPDQLLAIARLQQLFRRGAIDNAMLPPQKSPAEVLSDLTIEPLTVPEITFPDIETSSRAATDGERDRQS